MAKPSRSSAVRHCQLRSVRLEVTESTGPPLHTESSIDGQTHCRMARIGLLGKIIRSLDAGGYRQAPESAHWPSFAPRGSLGTMQSENERREAGAAARSHLPRSKLAEWAPPPGRQSPVAILAAQGTSRIQDLLPIRYERMRASAFAFLRGAAAIMAADLGSQPNTGLRVQLCGDAHLANFGSYASPEGNPVFDVNDFDETFPGPFDWDIKRLATSFYVNGLDQGESASSCRALAARCARHYRRHMQRLAGLTPLEAWNSKIDMAQAIDAIDHPKLRRRLEKRLRNALDASEAHYNLVDEDNTLIKDGGNIRHTETFAAVIDAAFAAYPATLQPQYADLVSRYGLADRALKIVGIGSVGTLCAIGLFASGDGAPAAAASEGSAELRAGAVCRRTTDQMPRRTRGNRPAQAAGAKRHLSGVDQKTH